MIETGGLFPSGFANEYLPAVSEYVIHLDSDAAVVHHVRGEFSLGAAPVNVTLAFIAEPYA